jgi:putative transposase
MRDDRYFERHVDYIRWNPVMHGWVKRVGAWPHSSFNAYVRRSFYPPGWAGNPGETLDGVE